VLIKKADAFINAKRSLETNPCVLSVNGQCNVTTSDRRNNSSIPTNSTPSATRDVRVEHNTRIPNALPIRATACPISPQPTTPNVRPSKSCNGEFRKQKSRLRTHAPSATDAASDAA
jgi:hypothetical protein